MPTINEVIGAYETSLQKHLAAIAHILMKAGAHDPIRHLEVRSNDLPSGWRMTWQEDHRTPTFVRNGKGELVPVIETETGDEILAIEQVPWRVIKSRIVLPDDEDGLPSPDRDKA